MDVTFSEEQNDLRDVVRDLLERHGPSDVEGPGGFDTTLWKRLTGELGLTGLPVPEEYGGASASTVDVAVVLSELGRALTPVPYLQTVVAASVLADAAAAGYAASAELLPALAEGALVAGFAPPAPAPLAARTENGLSLTTTIEHVVDGPHLGLLLTPAVVDGEPVLAAVRVPGEGVTVQRLPTLDRSRAQANIRLIGAHVAIVGDARAAERAVDLLLTAVAVESAGAARFCLDSTVEYLGTREQFGRPIGTFQALQHRCADLAVAVEAAASTAWYAAWAAGADPAGAAVAAPLAKAYCARVFRHVAGEMIQLHGGIGFTWEHPAHRYLKRATSTDLLFGGPAWVRATVARRAGLRP